MAENINLADDAPRARYIADGLQTTYEPPSLFLKKNHSSFT